MKRLLILALVVISGLVAIASADEAAKKEAPKPVTTLTGEVVDLYCYSEHQASGAEHAKCATSCITKGIPVGFLTTDGTMYVIVGKDHAPANAEVAPFAGKQSIITGTVLDAKGMKTIQLISISDVKADAKKG